MKIRLRVGDPKYWDSKEKWQFKANKNINGLIVLSIVITLIAFNAHNYMGAATFSIIMFLYIFPQKYQYVKWSKDYYRKINNVGIYANDKERDKV